MTAIVKVKVSSRALGFGVCGGGDVRCTFSLVFFFSFFNKIFLVFFFVFGFDTFRLGFLPAFWSRLPRNLVVQGRVSVH